jgi:hypothetical protein
MRHWAPVAFCAQLAAAKTDGATGLAHDRFFLVFGLRG